MMKFICFGSGSSGNCYYLYTTHAGILIDVGISTRILKKHFKDRQLPLQHIKNIIVTHDHADHIKAVGTMSEELQIPVYATEKVHKGIDSNYVVRGKVPQEQRHILQKNINIQINEFNITPFSVPHDSQDCVGFRIEHQGCVFVLMTDVGYVTDEMKTFINEANYLVIEANHDKEMLRTGPYPQFLKARVSSQIGHLDNHACAQAIAENATQKLKHVWLCHLSEENNHPELARKTIEAVLRSFGIIVGKDLQLEVLKRKTPSMIYDLS